MRKNPRIDMLIWFLLRDDRRVAQGWQSGLITSSGKKSLHLRPSVAWPGITSRSRPRVH